MRLLALAALVTLVAQPGVVAGALGQGSHRTKPQASSPPAAGPAAAAPNPEAALAEAARRKQSASTPEEVEAATRPYLALLLQQMAEVEMLKGQRTEALETLRSAAVADPDPANAETVATGLLQAGDAAAAVRVLQPAMPALADDAHAWALLGTAQRAAEDNAAAAESLAHALRLAPNAQVAYTLATVLLQLHRLADAQRLFTQLFNATDDAPVWHVAAGDAYRDARYYDQAIAEFEEAIRKDPRALHAEFFLGLTYLQMNEWGPSSASFEHLRRAVALSPHEYVSNFYLGALESTDGSDLQASDRHLETAAAADPAEPEVWLYLGLNANREHRTDVAEADFRKAIALTGADDSRNGWQIRRAYFALGRLLVQSDRRTEGLALLAKYKVAQAAAVAASGQKIQALNEGDAPALPDVAHSQPLAALKPSAVPETAPHPVLSAGERSRLSGLEASLRTALADGWNDLGVAEARMAQYPAAFRSFGQASTWGTPSRALLRNMAAAAFRSQDSAGAVAALHSYFATGVKAQEDDRAALMLAFSEFNLEHFAPAAHAFADVRDATLADNRAAYTYAFSLAHSGDAQAANAIVDKLTAGDLPPELRSLACHVYVDDEDYEGSLRCYRTMLTQTPEAPLAHYEAGEALVHLDRPGEAVTELQAQKALTPDDPRVEYALDYAMLQAGQKTEAQAALLRLVAAHPDEAAAQYQLGKLLLEQGKTPEALVHLQASERADAAPDYIHYQLGTAYRKTGQTAEAEREFSQYRAIKDAKRTASAVPAPAPAAKP